MRAGGNVMYTSYCIKYLVQRQYYVVLLLYKVLSAVGILLLPITV
jgi:hypothetical protein